MKYQEIAGGIRIPLSNEEQLIINEIKKAKNKLAKSKLDEREREVAKKLVSRGVLNRFKDNDLTYFEVNKIEEINRY